MADTGTETEDKRLVEWREKRNEVAAQYEERERLTPSLALGIIIHDLYGLTWKEVAERIRDGRGYDNFRRSARSPAGKRLREQIQELADHPKELAKLYMQAQSMDVTVDFLAALQWAKDARDYRAVHSMTKDLLQFAGLRTDEKKESVSQQAIHIHLDAGSLDTPAVQTSYEVVEADVVDD